MTFDRMLMNACYVFLDTGPEPLLVAKYQIDERGIGHFAYGTSYADRQDSFPLDPLNLAITSPLGSYISTRRDASFGALSDATPDKWGRMSINALHKGAPRSEVEWLLSSKGNGVGGLVFSGSKTMTKQPSAIPAFGELEAVIQMAEQLLRGEIGDISPEMEKLIKFGSSMGGARPKSLVSHEGKEWIAKLNRPDDLMDVSQVEYASMQFAKHCGIKVPALQIHTINGRNLLLVERFDRNGATRKRHYLSANTLLNVDKIDPSDTRKNYSYMGIAGIIRRIAEHPTTENIQLYNRMLFNAMIGNTDDHLKNHGFLLVNQQRSTYELSPAFDVLPHLSGSAMTHAIGVGPEGRDASKSNLLAAGELFGLVQKEPELLYAAMKDKVADWRAFFREHGVNVRDVATLSNRACFALAEEPDRSLHAVTQSGPAMG